MSWVLLQILGAFIVAIIHGVGKHYGLTWFSFSIYAAGCVLFLSWLYPYVYSIAPSYLQAFFFGSIVISIFGFITSFLVFKEVVNVWNMVGAVGGIICSILLVYK